MRSLLGKLVPHELLCTSKKVKLEHLSQIVVYSNQVTWNIPELIMNNLVYSFIGV